MDFHSCCLEKSTIATHIFSWSNYWRFRQRVQQCGSHSKPVPVRSFLQSTTNCPNFSFSKSQTSSGTSPVSLFPSNVHCSNSSNRPYCRGIVPVNWLFFICNRVMFQRYPSSVGNGPLKSQS